MGLDGPIIDRARASPPRSMQSLQLSSLVLPERNIATRTVVSWPLSPPIPRVQHIVDLATSRTLAGDCKRGSLLASRVDARWQHFASPQSLPSMQSQPNCSSIASDYCVP